MRRLVGGCYLALREGNPDRLRSAPATELLHASGLAPLHAALCQRFGLVTDSASAAAGLLLSAGNERRWQHLTHLLDSLHAEGIEPVIFKGGALVARWPEWLGLRIMEDIDLIVPQAHIGMLRTHLAAVGFRSEVHASKVVHWLSKGSLVWRGQGIDQQILDLHTRVTEPPTCASLTRSLLASRATASGVRIPDVEDCVCMIALHIVRSGMARPLKEYIDLLWYVDGMNGEQWQQVVARARLHHVSPALFLSLRQALHCSAIGELAPARWSVLNDRMAALEQELSPWRRREIDRLAPPDYPLHQDTSRNRPVFRRSVIMLAGTSSAWRVAAAFIAYGAARTLDRFGVSR